MVFLVLSGLLAFVGMALMFVQALFIEQTTAATFQAAPVGMTGLVLGGVGIAGIVLTLAVALIRNR